MHERGYSCTSHWWDSMWSQLSVVWPSLYILCRFQILKVSNQLLTICFPGSSFYPSCNPSGALPAGYNQSGACLEICRAVPT